MNTKSQIILGLVGAAAAGVLIGLIIAPEKGTDLRQRISSTAGDWADHLSDVFANAKDNVGDLVNKGKDAIAKGKDAAKNAANEAGNKYDNLKESYS